MDHLFAGPLIAETLVDMGLSDGNICVVSPDVGGVTRARALAESLKTSIAIIAKRRPEPGKVEILEIIGDIRGRHCVMIDDMIDTGGTIVHGVEALLERGAENVTVCCTHPIFSQGALSRLMESPVKQIICTDTIPLTHSEHIESGRLKILSVAPLLADAIRRIHEDDSVSELFDRTW